MLALTTYFEPRNLLIDLAFLGLSTITSERSAAARRADVLANFVFLPANPWASAAFALAAARFVALGLAAVPFSERSFRRTFLATVSSYLSSSCSPLRSIRLDPRSRGTRARLRLPCGENPDTMKVGPAIDQTPRPFQ